MPLDEAEFHTKNSTFYRKGKMIEIIIPGYKTLTIEHLVLDYNGTLAIDGKLIPGVKEKLLELSEKLHIHIITADTFGRVRKEVTEIPCELSILPKENQDTGKREYVKRLGPAITVCIGNGRIDRLMLEDAILGIVVVQEEGTAVESIQLADVMCPSIISALELLTNPLRLIATLRS